MLDSIKVTNAYLNKTDWRIKENSSVSYSIGGLILHQSGAVSADYWLNEIYPEEIRKAHINADVHIHDLCILSSYCSGYGLKDLLAKGIRGAVGKTTAAPAKHLGSACQQIISFLGILQNEEAGAKALNGVDTFLAPFIKKDNLSEKEVRQCIEQLVFGLNMPSRWGTQAPFSNISIDWNCPKDMKDKKVVIAGEEQDFTYGDCQEEMAVFNRNLFQVYLKGDADGNGFEYPIPTIAITENFDWSDPNCEWLFKVAAKYGSPYFANYVGSNLNPEDVRSMCCRLRLDLRELRSRGGGLFGAYDSTGSIGVVTLNLPRLGYTANKESQGDEEKAIKIFYEKLEKLMNIAYQSLEIKRRFLNKNFEEGLYPYTKFYLGGYGNHFSTIGLVGMNEACENLFNENIMTDKGYKFSQDVLNFMRNKLSDYQEESGNLYNLEESPAEGASYRLAKHDKEKYPDIITAGTHESPYYTNSSHIPVNYTSDLWASLNHQEKLQALYTGGTAFHIWLDDGIESWQVARDLVKKVCESSKIPYISLTPTFSVCPIHGYIKGHYERCPKCRDEQIEKYQEKLHELQCKIELK
jgi:anaerobic ribonucleoside-triphosphate reductase